VPPVRAKGGERVMEDLSGLAILFALGPLTIIAACGGLALVLTCVVLPVSFFLYDVLHGIRWRVAWMRLMRFYGWAR
jgi:hypothetical protein